jgi:hypothetical protein
MRARLIDGAVTIVVKKCMVNDVRKICKEV